MRNIQPSQGSSYSASDAEYSPPMYSPDAAYTRRPASANGRRRVWVRRPQGPCTMVMVADYDLVDDFKLSVTQKFPVGLGKTIDSPDLVLRVRPRLHSALSEKLLAPEESITRVLDAYYPGGQSVDEAILVETPHAKRTPLRSPLYLTTDLHGTENHEYFPPVPVEASPPHNSPPPAPTIAPPPPRSTSPVKAEEQPVANMLQDFIPPINVLIVEDNIINQRILQTWMKRRDVKCKVASDGGQAVRDWRTGGFHLVLMDIQLPVMSGIDATKEIRRLERLNQIGVFSDPKEGELADEDKLPTSFFKSPVIIVALTASSLQSDRDEALAAGCNDFLTKPVSLVWLEKKITEWGCMQALIDFEGWRKWRGKDKLTALASSKPRKESGLAKEVSPGSADGSGSSTTFKLAAPASHPPRARVPAELASPPRMAIIARYGTMQPNPGSV